jgi:hypothetical protein
MTFGSGLLTFILLSSIKSRSLSLRSVEWRAIGGIVQNWEVSSRIDTSYVNVRLHFNVVLQLKQIDVRKYCKRIALPFLAKCQLYCVDLYPSVQQQQSEPYYVFASSKMQYLLRVISYLPSGFAPRRFSCDLDDTLDR